MDLQRVPQNSATDRVALPRRAFLGGLVGLIAAPVVVKADILNSPSLIFPSYSNTSDISTGAQDRSSAFPN
jgi:hypothetical protein